MEYINFSNQLPVIIQLGIDWSINFLAAVITLIVGIWISSRIGKWVKEALIRIDQSIPN